VKANRELIKTKAGEWAVQLKDALPDIWKWTVRITKALAGFLVISAIVKTITALVTVFGWLSAAATFLGSAFAWLSVSLAPLGVAIGAITWPIILIGLAIAALAALVWAYWPEISSFFTAVWDWVKVTWGQMAEWIGELWTRILHADYAQLFIEQWSGVGAFFQRLWDGIASGFTRLITPIIDAVSGLFGGADSLGKIAPGIADGQSAGVSAPQMVPLQGRAAAEDMIAANQHTDVNGTITVESLPGTRAQVKGKPRNIALDVQPSGAF
jgi:hypothetical protein